MTLQQLKYIDAIATCGSISEASRRVFISQPTLTESVRLLEEELRIAIFNRTRKGVVMTREGEEFLASARQILNDAERIQSKYTGKAVRAPQFAVSCQHYAFVAEAFINVVKHLRRYLTISLSAKLSQWACSCLFNMNIDDFLMHLSESPILML